jgi:hypothetical protein
MAGLPGRSRRGHCGRACRGSLECKSDRQPDAPFPRFPRLRADPARIRSRDESRGFASCPRGRPWNTLEPSPCSPRTRSQSRPSCSQRSAAGRCCWSSISRVSVERAVAPLSLRCSRQRRPRDVRSGAARSCLLHAQAAARAAQQGVATTCTSTPAGNAILRRTALAWLAQRLAYRCTLRFRHLACFSASAGESSPSSCSTVSSHASAEA